jgi:hypothetical protein
MKYTCDGKQIDTSWKLLYSVESFAECLKLVSVWPHSIAPNHSLLSQAGTGA